MSYIAVPLTEALAIEIALNLSPRDRAEVLAVIAPRLGQSEAEALTEWAKKRATGVGFVNDKSWAVVFLEPSGLERGVAMGGIFENPSMMEPWLANTWCVGTSERVSVTAAGVTCFRQARYAMRCWREMPGHSGCKFVCICLDAEGGPSSDWLECLGFSLEGILVQHGRHGETFKIWGNTHGR